MTRQEAKAAGESTYTTCKPCKTCGAQLRYTSKGNCKPCRIAQGTYWTRLFNERHPEKNKKWCKRYREANRDKFNDYGREFRKKYPERHCATQAKRRATKFNATPSWADLKRIKEIYADCPKGYHVDHIIPLKGKNVCGLHVEYNLQYLPANENIRKGNRLLESQNF